MTKAEKDLFFAEANKPHQLSFTLTTSISNASVTQEPTLLTRGDGTPTLVKALDELQAELNPNITILKIGESIEQSQKQVAGRSTGGTGRSTGGNGTRIP